MLRDETNFSSPASLFEGEGGQGAGGGLGFKPQTPKVTSQSSIPPLAAECRTYLPAPYHLPSFSRQVGINYERRGSGNYLCL